MKKLVIVESPYAGEVDLNLEYLRAAMLDCLVNRGEAPFASHGLYTQPGVLDDTKPFQRALGIEAGFAWGRVADLTAVYVDRGLSSGMRQGIDRSLRDGRPVQFRSLLAWRKQAVLDQVSRELVGHESAARLG